MSWTAPPLGDPPPPATLAVPTKPVRGFDFSDYQTTNPLAPLPGDQVDTEIDRSNGSIAEVIDRLALIQRDDGELANGIVGEDQMDPEFLEDLEDSIGGAIIAEATAQADRAEQEADRAELAADRIPDPATGAANDIIVVNATLDGYRFRQALMRDEADATQFDAENLHIANLAEPIEDHEATTKNYVDTAVAAGGFIPPVVAGEENFVLTAMAPGNNWDWAQPTLDQLADLTAFCKNILQNAADDADFRAAIDVYSTGEVDAVEAGLQGQITANDGDIAALQGDVATNTADIAALDGRVTANEGDIATNTADIATNAGNIAANTGEIAANDADIAALDGRVTALEGAGGSDGEAKAWINFNQSSGNAIRDSFNVSSIGDHGSGDHTINFSTPFATIGFAVGITAGHGGTTSNGYCFTLGPVSAGSQRFLTRQVSAQNGAIDMDYLHFTAHGRQ